MSRKNKHFFIQQSKLSETPEIVWNLITKTEFYSRITPPWLRIEDLNADRHFDLGSVFKFKVKNGLLQGVWTCEVTHMRPGFLIGMRLKSPQQKQWIVWTKCLPGETKDECVLENRVEYVCSPLMGKTRKKIDSALRSLIYYTHRTLKNDFIVSARIGTPLHRKVLIAGGTGFIGTKLRDFLSMWGYEVEILSTKPESGNLYWDPSKGLLNPDLLERKDVIINLCGSSVSCRWTRKNRKQILDSRVGAAHLLEKTILRLEHPPSVFIQVSGSGYYGYDNSGGVTETAPSGKGFLAEVCQKWEAEAQDLQNYTTQLVIARLGVVLSPEGGALAKMSPGFRMGFGGTLGSGKQYFPWISMNDLLYMFWFMLEKSEYKGVFNVCAPNTPTNQELTQSLAAALGKRAIFPVPAVVLRLLFGHMAREMLIGGVQTVPQHAIECGFEYFDGDPTEFLQVSLGE
jgi:uncharacterized protein